MLLSPLGRGKYELTVEHLPPQRAQDWFCLSLTGTVLGDGASAGLGGDGASEEASKAIAPIFWMHLSQEYFLVCEQSYNPLLNEFTLKCPGPRCF